MDPLGLNRDVLKMEAFTPKGSGPVIPKGHMHTHTHTCLRTHTYTNIHNKHRVFLGFFYLLDYEGSIHTSDILGVPVIC